MRLEKVHLVTRIIVDAFREGTFSYPYRSDWRPDHELSDTDNSEEIYYPEVQSNNEKFYTPKKNTKRYVCFRKRRT